MPSTRHQRHHLLQAPLLPLVLLLPLHRLPVPSPVLLATVVRGTSVIRDISNTDTNRWIDSTHTGGGLLSALGSVQLKKADDREVPESAVLVVYRTPFLFVWLFEVEGLLTAFWCFFTSLRSILYVVSPSHWCHGFACPFYLPFSSPFSSASAFLLPCFFFCSHRHLEEDRHNNLWSTHSLLL